MHIYLRKYLAVFAMLVVFLSASKDASAQNFAGKVKNYTPTTFTTAFSSIIGQLGTTNLGYGSYPYSSYPYYYTTISLPFNFNYDSTDYTAGSTVYLHNNGAMSFAYTGNWDYGYCISNGYQAQFPSYINAWGMVYYPYNYSSGIYSQVSGPVGNRVWTLEYPNVSTYYSGSTVSIQIKIYETTNTVEFLYSQNSKNMSYGYVGDIGMNGVGNGNLIGYDVTYYYFRYKNPFYTPPTQLRYQPKQLTNIQLSVQPKNLNFGALPTGLASAPQCVTVTNTGTFGTLNINSAVITGNSDFTLTSIPASNSYPIGASDQYCVTFTPNQPGIRTATLTIGSNGQDSAVQSVSLSGIGTVAEYTIDSLIRFKKTRTRMGDSLTQYLHITSTGVSPFIISNYNLIGADAGQYFISYMPAMPMATGKMDSIGITYVPTIEGKHVATLQIISNSFSKPSLNISLQGTGILPHIVVTPAALLFDSTKEGQTVCKTITIWNPGSDTLKLFSNQLTSNDGDFVYTGLSGQDSLIPPDHTKTVTVCFTPKQQGARQARLTLRTNIIMTFETPRRDTASLISIDISGTGVPFGVFANGVSGSPFLDSAIVGVQVCRTDTLKNNGDADILITDASFTGGVFTQTGLPTLPFLLKARKFIVFQLCATPDKEGLLTGSLTFTGRTGGSTISMNLPLGIYGLKSCASPTPGELFTSVVLPNNGSDSSLCVWIHNCGDIASTFTAVLSGTSAADYTINSPATTASIAPGDSVQFCLTYKPSAVGSSNASLDVTSPTAPNVNVPLGGRAACAALAAVSPNIPKTGVGAKQPFTITINNTGGFLWNPGTSATVTPAGVFTIDNTTLADVAPTTGSLNVTGSFNPVAMGVVIAKVTFPNAGPCGNTLEIDLSGEGVVNGVEPTSSANGFILEQSYPNPSQGMTNFTYSAPREAEVRITLVDLTGKLIRTLIEGRVSEGMHTVNFDAKNLPSGTYAYVLESMNTRLVRQLILTK